MCISFVVAGYLEMQLSKSNPIIPSLDETSFNFVNGLPCTLNVTLQPAFSAPKLRAVPLPGSPELHSYTATMRQYENVLFSEIPAVDYNITIEPFGEGGCTVDLVNGTQLQFSPRDNLPQPAQVQTFLISNDTLGNGVLVASQTRESLTKSDEANAKCRIIGDIPEYALYSIHLTSPLLSNYSSAFSSKDQETLDFELDPGT